MRAAGRFQFPLPVDLPDRLSTTLLVAWIDWLAVADELDDPAWWLDRAVDAVVALRPADGEASNRAV